MEIYEYIIKQYLDTCSDNIHDLDFQRKITNTYLEQLEKAKNCIIIEDKRLKELEDGRLNKVSKKSKTVN